LADNQGLPFATRIANFIDGGRRQREVDGLQSAIRELGQAIIESSSFESGSSPVELVRKLQEQSDSATLLQMVYDLEYDMLSGTTASLADTGRERELATLRSERLFRLSPLAQWSIQLWTGWGLGDRTNVKCADPAAQAVWDEFFRADRNEQVLGDDSIFELSDWLLVKGNRFLAFFASTADGTCTIRNVLQEEITEILCNPSDSSEPWFYKRQPTSSTGKVMYYPDYKMAFSDDLDDHWNELAKLKKVEQGAIRADKVRNVDGIPGTTVCILHIAHNRKDEKSLWGWPITTVSANWLNAHKKFMESRLAVAMSKAAFVRRTTVAGGSMAVDSVISKIKSMLSTSSYSDSNPPPAPGSWHVQNKAAETEELPMTTGSGDAERDWKMFSHQALLGVGLFPTSAGMDTSRWATALEMDKSQSMVFARYGTFMAAQFRHMVWIVLSYKEKYGAQTFSRKDAQASSDTFSLSDFPAMARAIGVAVGYTLTPLIDNGTIGPEQALPIIVEMWRILLQALGVNAANDVLEKLAASTPVVAKRPAGQPVPSNGDGQGPADEETSQIAATILQAVDNYRTGAVDAENLLDFAIGEVMDLRGDGHNGK
jgi:hypothetical protein